MARTPTSTLSAEEFVEVSKLRFDLRNPRIPTEIFSSDDEIVRFMLDEFDIEELVQSILSSGWIDYEPLILESGTYIVYEGNRRLTALRLISDVQLRERMKYRLPAIVDPQPVPDAIRARYVSSRAEARRFIAFKHINGPFKWDAYAKAKYASDWLSEGEDIDIVSKMLGDNHNTIRRLVAGFNVLEQAQSRGFDLNDRSKKRFSFSHLYTAVSRPAVRSYLGIDDDEIVTAPVPDKQGHNLDNLMSWLYGQESKKEPTVIASQNPNLNQLVRVIENETALLVLVRTRRLDRAFEQVEPPSARFKEALIGASRECENALGLSTHYNGEDTLLSIAKNLAITVRSLRDAMVRKSLGDGEDL